MTVVTSYDLIENNIKIEEERYISLLSLFLVVIYYITFSPLIMIHY